jgi:cation diffusion facilitator family transporter
MIGPSTYHRDQARRSEADAAHAVKERALRSAIYSALIQTVVKAVAGMITGSLALLATAADSLADFMNVAIGRVAITLGRRPPDEDHPFGHGKVEPVGALLQAFVILPIAAILIYQGVKRLSRPVELALPGIAVAVMLGAIVLAWWTARRLRAAAGATDSVALAGTSLTFAVDMVTHSGVIASVLIMEFTGWTAADSVVSFAVAAWVAAATLKLAWSVFHDLLDTQLPDSYRERVIMELEEHRQEFLDYHRLRTRRAGPEKHIDLHMTICRYRTLEESHRLVDHLENAIEAIIPQSQVIIHVDPCESGQTCPGEGTCELASRRKGVMPETDWPAHPTGAEAREAERAQHRPPDQPQAGHR